MGASYLLLHWRIQVAARELAVRLGKSSVQQLSSLDPTPELKSQSMKVCSSVPGVAWEHNLHSGEGTECILWSFSWVHSRFNNNFHRKEARSGGTPFSL